MILRRRETHGDSRQRSGHPFRRVRLVTRLATTSLAFLAPITIVEVIRGDS